MEMVGNSTNDEKEEHARKKKNKKKKGKNKEGMKVEKEVKREMETEANMDMQKTDEKEAGEAAQEEPRLLVMVGKPIIGSGHVNRERNGEQKAGEMLQEATKAGPSVTASSNLFPSPAPSPLPMDAEEEEKEAFADLVPSQLSAPSRITTASASPMAVEVAPPSAVSAGRPSPPPSSGSTPPIGVDRKNDANEFDYGLPVAKMATKTEEPSSAEPLSSPPERVHTEPRRIGEALLDVPADVLPLDALQVNNVAMLKEVSISDMLRYAVALPFLPSAGDEEVLTYCQSLYEAGKLSRDLLFQIYVLFALRKRSLHDITKVALCGVNAEFEFVLSVSMYSDLVGRLMEKKGSNVPSLVAELTVILLQAVQDADRERKADSLLQLALSS
mmetsp:Transcript_9264/g.25206  ORF Transcript_9264/g.25206 Transcript_9264/m.25206 type:complete len:386 (-) Transcript_9264:59-1216(-)